MFDVGLWELGILFVVALLVLGPDRLPAVTRVVGGYVRKARRTWNTLRAEIESELAADEIRKSIKEPISELDELRKSAQQEFKDIERETNASISGDHDKDKETPS